MSTSIPGATGDPLPAPPLTEGQSTNFAAGHRLIFIGSNTVLDWVPNSGKYRILPVSRSAAAGTDPLGGAVLCQGTWAKITDDHELVFLGDDRLLDWIPAVRRFKVWRIDRAAAGNADPLPDPPLTEGVWNLGADHQMIALDGDRVLDWVSTTGDFRVWEQNHFAAGAANPLGQSIGQANWGTTLTNHTLIAVGQDRVLDWAPFLGDFRVRRYDPAVAADPFPGDPETTGQWTTVVSGHNLIYLDGNRVLDWQSNGKFRMWRYDRNVTTLRRRTVKLHLKILHPPRAADANIDNMMANAKALYASYGFELIEMSREDLRAGGADLSTFNVIFIDECRRSDGASAHITDLFNKFRNNVGPQEVVIYFVRGLSTEDTGCANHPTDKPGAMIASRDATKWTLAHELGHVLGLDHMDFLDANRLMNGKHTGVLTNPHPDLTTDELTTMLASNFARP